VFDLRTISINTYKIIPLLSLKRHNGFYSLLIHSSLNFAVSAHKNIIFFFFNNKPVKKVNKLR